MKIAFIILIFHLYILNADTFVSLNTKGSIKNALVYQESLSSRTLVSSGPSYAISADLGYQSYLSNSKFKIEPNVGYTSHHVDVYSINMFYFDMPLLYDVFIFNQKFSIGPYLKLYYLYNIEESDVDYEIQNSSLTTLNSSYGLKLNLEFSSIDLFIFYEYITGDIFYSRWNGTTSISTQITTQGSYIGYGIRIRY